MNAESKVTAEHLQRAAYLYIRQSTFARCWRTPRARSVNTPCAARVRWVGRKITLSIVHRRRASHRLRSRPERLRAKGWLTTKQIAPQIGGKPNLVKYWRQQGLLQGIRLNDKEEYLYQSPHPDMVTQIKQRTRTSFESSL